MKKLHTLLLLICCSFCFSLNSNAQQLNVAVAGMNHDHIYVLLHQYQQHQVNIIGIAEPDKTLRARFQKNYNLPDSIFFNDIKSMLTKVHPDAVLAYNPIAQHIDVAEVCLPMHIPLMVEKPLATTMKQAKRIEELSKQNNTVVLTNYETTWYSSNQKIKEIVAAKKEGKIIKMIAKDGHQGPKEIGCSSYFLSWLTDPVLNGSGALNDFGCYGANLMTWMMNNEKPVAVTAFTHHFKPEVYPKVDDDATIIIEYKDGTTGMIEASWNWPYNIKDFQVYGKDYSLHAKNGNTLMEYNRWPKGNEVSLDNSYYPDQIAYLKAVLAHKQSTETDLSSLKNNMIVVEILTAAKKSAQEGKKIYLKHE
ncbi:Gfo/Idh/MocA family protein [Zhouia sp. PK063]|uniref:Gfo/Idh/MocA family protein n=1 Tax=Zhouia sp. PK063 TaxID=3373602 RepID=UPI0037B0F499